MEDLQYTRSDAVAIPKPRISAARSACEVVIMKTGRYNYLRALLGDTVLDEYDSWTIKAAVDGVYHITPLVRRELTDLAEAVAAADGTLSRLGKGTVFARLVQKFKAEQCQ